MPARLSFEGKRNAEPPEYTQAKSLVSPQNYENDIAKTTEPHVTNPTPAAVPAPEPISKSPTTDKPLGFREIANIQSHAERIATYNNTRVYWANNDHGLNDWLDSSMAQNPDLATQPLAQQIPVSYPTTSRHRATGSLSLFGKHHAPSSSKVYEQQSPTAATSSTAAFEASPGGHGGRSASFQMQATKGQMQAKGKDLLHKAEVFSGKGMTGAKGLFAKGKSRFRGGSDKVDK
jgi:hypothetical protein